MCLLNLPIYIYIYIYIYIVYLPSLKQRRAQLCEKNFIQIEEPQRKLYKLLPKPRTTTYNTRCRTGYSLPRVKTTGPRTASLTGAFSTKRTHSDT